MTRLRFTSLLLAVNLPVMAAGSFSINFTFEGGLTPSQEAIFLDAKSAWEDLIVGYQPGITQTGIDISAGGAAIDGLGGTLGASSPSSAIYRGGYWLARTGTMTFDSADLAAKELEGTLDETVMHEIGHVLGIGTLWDENWNGLYVNGTGQYTGAFALDAYRDEFDPLATYVPVEMGGGAGTMNGHWEEVDLGHDLTGLTDRRGRDMRLELMTGWLGDPTDVHYIGNTTLGSLRDLGFDVVAMPVPEPGPAALLGLGALLGAIRRQRRNPVNPPKISKN